MRFILTALLVTLAVCAPTAEDTLLRCDDCAEARVTRVIDGDTFDTETGRVRLLGIDTPETGERCARQATNRFSELAGGSVRLEDGPRLTDQFGRHLAYVYTEDVNSVDEILIQEGLAVARTEDGQHRDFLVGLEKGTRMMKDGCLWSR